MILQTRTMRPEPRHIARPGTRPFYLEHSGQLVITATMWDVVLRDLYDLVRGGRYDQYIRFLVAEGAGLFAAAGVALDTGDFPAGVDLNLVNNGRVQGKGGNGGKGGDADASGTTEAGGNGDAGGTAILAQHDLTIDNTDGKIWGGGGGGGGGGASSDLLPGDSWMTVLAGSGGGGAAGTIVGVGGAKGIATGGSNDTLTDGDPGSNGTANAGGAGGTRNADGGNGGDPGEAGANGQNATGGSNGGAGGAAGNAIEQSGGTVTFSGGNNSTQVKGGIV